MSSRDVRRLAGSGHFCPPEVFHISPQLPFVLSWANTSWCACEWGPGAGERELRTALGEEGHPRGDMALRILGEPGNSMLWLVALDWVFSPCRTSSYEGGQGSRALLLVSGSHWWKCKSKLENLDLGSGSGPSGEVSKWQLNVVLGQDPGLGVSWSARC